MERNGIQISTGVLTIPTGNLRAARAIYETVSSGRNSSAADNAGNRGSGEPYTVSLSSRSRQPAEADFRRDRQREAADFKRKEQQEEADFKRNQMRAKADFERQERQMETEFHREQQQDAIAFTQGQRQKQTRFQRQLSQNRYQEATSQEP
ncbi:MAG: hypothetical protein C4522_13505 [Desulfobacteraceae bacterium]|nr:MAG: hypothetical protein C4522_13505 [Desulfobacteraceae bacterium]